jgi:hypothetical protein
MTAQTAVFVTSPPRATLDLFNFPADRALARAMPAPSRDWLKVKNPDRPVMIRARGSNGDVMAQAFVMTATKLGVATGGVFGWS